jgi:hypothetical protein
MGSKVGLEHTETQLTRHSGRLVSLDTCKNGISRVDQPGFGYMQLTNKVQIITIHFTVCEPASSEIVRLPGKSTVLARMLPFELF